MIIDGRQIAKEIIDSLISTRGNFPDTLSLGVLMTGGDAASASFVMIKEKTARRLGVTLVREFLDAETSQQDAQAKLRHLSQHTDAVIVQLPIPPHLSPDQLLEYLPPSKDIDALSPMPLVEAPVAGAVLEVLSHSNVSLEGKKIVVVGEGRLVGRPVAEALRKRGGKVIVVTLEHGSLEMLTDANIVVSGAGSPALIKPAMLKRGVVLIDAGTSESNAKIVGDAEPLCAEVASVFTPVPGGIGPIAVAMLFQNFFTLLTANR